MIHTAQRHGVTAFVQKSNMSEPNQLQSFAERIRRLGGNLVAGGCHRLQIAAPFRDDGLFRRPSGDNGVLARHRLKAAHGNRRRPQKRIFFDCIRITPMYNPGTLDFIHHALHAFRQKTGVIRTIMIGVCEERVAPVTVCQRLGPL